MVYENNIPKIETIYEIKEEYKTPSFEEFVKNYNENEEISDNYQSEFGSYEDVRVKGLILAENAAIETATKMGIEAGKFVDTSIAVFGTGSDIYNHREHKDRGINYKSDCSVCNS